MKLNASKAREITATARKALAASRCKVGRQTEHAKRNELSRLDHPLRRQIIEAALAGEFELELSESDYLLLDVEEQLQARGFLIVDFGKIGGLEYGNMTLLRLQAVLNELRSYQEDPVAHSDSLNLMSERLSELLPRWTDKEVGAGTLRDLEDPWRLILQGTVASMNLLYERRVREIFWRINADAERWRTREEGVLRLSWWGLDLRLGQRDLDFFSDPMLDFYDIMADVGDPALEDWEFDYHRFPDIADEFQEALSLGGRPQEEWATANGYRRIHRRFPDDLLTGYGMEWVTGGAGAHLLRLVAQQIEVLAGQRRRTMQLPFRKFSEWSLFMLPSNAEGVLCPATPVSLAPFVQEAGFEVTLRESNKSTEGLLNIAW